MSTLNLNEVRLAGNIGNDIELKTTPNGVSLCQFTLASHSTVKNKEGESVQVAEWHRIIAFGDVAKHIEKHCQKGTNIYLTGKLQTRFYQGENQAKVERTEVLVRAYQTISGEKEDDEHLLELMEKTAKANSEKRQKEAENGEEIPY